MPLDFDQILEGYREQYPPTLNTTQVAEMLGSTREVVRTKVAAGEIPPTGGARTSGTSETKSSTGSGSKRRRDNTTSRRSVPP
jgi:hypothetical protein